MRGIHGRQGPPPDPHAIRRERNPIEWIHLPATGRIGPAPEWPLTRQTSRERAFWEHEWKRPQAVMWEANGQDVEVALYVRSLADAERPKAPVALRTLVRQQQEALGVSIPGLARNRWTIDHRDTEQAVVPSEARETTKDRLRLMRALSDEIA